MVKKMSDEIGKMIYGIIAITLFLLVANTVGHIVDDVFQISCQSWGSIYNFKCHNIGGCSCTEFGYYSWLLLGIVALLVITLLIFIIYFVGSIVDEYIFNSD
jgi:hypothetical protein